MCAVKVDNSTGVYVVKIGDELERLYYRQKAFNLGLHLKAEALKRFDSHNVNIADLCEYVDIEYSHGLEYLCQLFTQAYNSGFFTEKDQDGTVINSRTFADAFRLWSSITHVQLDGLDTDILIVYNHVLEEEQRLKERIAARRGQAVESVVIQHHRLPLSGLKFIIDGEKAVLGDNDLLRALLSFLKKSKQLTSKEKDTLCLYFYDCVKSNIDSWGWNVDMEDYKEMGEISPSVKNLVEQNGDLYW